MVLNASISNFLGIRSFEISFVQKHVYQNGQSEQVLSYDENTHYSLVPTFLAKNATGKTSFVKAMSFALTFCNEKEFVSEISSYIRRNIEEYYFANSGKNKVSFTIFKNEIANKIVKTLFEELSYAGSKNIELNINFVGKRNLKMNLSNDFFLVEIGKTRINVTQFINEIILNITKDLKNKNSPSFETLMRINESINQITKKAASKYSFFNIKFDTIFRDSSRMVKTHELLIKHKTSTYIKKLVEEIGFQAVSTLLKKMDSKITKIDLDIQTKSIDIFIKNSLLPISARNLSFGTQKVLEILYKSVPLFKNGGVMIIDEIENGLHISLIKLIVLLFEDEDINSQKAQLFLTTHNPLIFERKVVLPSNCYMSENDNFENLKFFASRTYDLEKIVKSKNYYNEFLWYKINKESRSSLSSVKISQIINEIEGGINCQK